MTLWLHDSYLKSSAHVTWNVISALRGHGIFHDAVCDTLPSVLWRCWLGGRKGIRPVKNFEWCSTGVVICLERDADLHMAQLKPLPLTVSCFSKIQIGFTFLVPAHPGSPGHRAVKWVCVCVCMRDVMWCIELMGCNLFASWLLILAQNMYFISVHPHICNGIKWNKC